MADKNCELLVYVTDLPELDPESLKKSLQLLGEFDFAENMLLTNCCCVYITSDTGKYTIKNPKLVNCANDKIMVCGFDAILQ